VRAIRRISQRKLALAAGLLLLIAGGTLAGVTAGDQGKAKHGALARAATQPATPGERVTPGQRAPAAKGARAGDLMVAASYLGLSVQQLKQDLRSGQSLAQIANARPGRSASGLIDMLVAAERKRLSALSASVVQRVTAEVNRRGGRASRALPEQRARSRLFAGPPRLLLVAAKYLGLSPRQLRGELRSGQSLAQIADGLGGGRSAAGLKDALLAAARARLTAAVSAGRLTKARADVIGSRLQRRLTVLLSRRRHKR
jgi:hypothetical protein